MLTSNKDMLPFEALEIVLQLVLAALITWGADRIWSSKSRSRPLVSARLTIRRPVTISSNRYGGRIKQAAKLMSKKIKNDNLVFSS